MKELTTYLFFDGNCREAMNFYKSCLGGELHLMPFSAAPCDLGKSAKAAADRTMHAQLKNGSAVLMASDIMPGMDLTQGHNFSISINCESMEEIQRLFSALGEGGEVTTALHDAFWGAHFGMLKDKFGVNWMFNFEQPKKI